MAVQLIDLDERNPIRKTLPRYIYSGGVDQRRRLLPNVPVILERPCV